MASAISLDVNESRPMFPKPKPVLVPNTLAFESEPMVKATGFREYDARWLFGKEINLMGIQALGMGLGALIAELGVKPEVVTAHDFRGYSASIKYALISGLQAAGCRVHDIGLAMTPMAYFAQFELDVPCVAMVTASHNDNGWTGVKMGANRPLTFGPDEMNRLKEIVLNADFNNKAGGDYAFHENFPQRYIADLTDRPKLKRGLKVVVACGNGTAGAFAPQVMEAIGCEVVPLDTELDHTFSKYNPNPEDMEMLHAIRDAVLQHKADVGLGFDGDGDRCGVVDNTGEEIFADRSEEHTSELQSQSNVVCRLLLEKKKVAVVRHASFEVAAEQMALTQSAVSMQMRALEIDFFFNDSAPTESYTLPLHDALPI